MDGLSALNSLRAGSLRKLIAGVPHRAEGVVVVEDVDAAADAVVAEVHCRRDRARRPSALRYQTSHADGAATLRQWVPEHTELHGTRSG